MKPDRFTSARAAATERVESVYAERDIAIARRVRDGESMASVARAYGLSRQRVSVICHEHGLQKRKWTRRR